jgi:hypothetical protein
MWADGRVLLSVYFFIVFFVVFFIEYIEEPTYGTIAGWRRGPRTSADPPAPAIHV